MTNPPGNPTDNFPRNECNLGCLKRGQKGIVAHVAGPQRCRLLEMGFTRGAVVEVCRKAAFGGPLELRLRSYRISLRVDEAEAILVVPVADE